MAITVSFLDKNYVLSSFERFINIFFQLKNLFIYDQLLTERLFLIALSSVFSAFLIISTAFLTYAEEKKIYCFSTRVWGRGELGK